MDPKMALLTRQSARDTVAKLCFMTKRDSKGSKKRVPRGMITRLVNKVNQETRGLGLTSVSVRRKVDRLWSKHMEISNSDTESETDPEDDSVVTVNSIISDLTSESRMKGGRPVNTSNIDIATKKAAKLDLMNNVTAEWAKLREGMGSKRVSSTTFATLVLQCK